MDDFFRKLNTLIKANVNDVLNNAGGDSPLHRLRSLIEDGDSDNEGRVNAPEQIEKLQKRMEEAFEYEDQLKARVEQLQQEALELDAQADQAIVDGREADARHFNEIHVMAMQRLKMAEAELRDHEMLTQYLMREINALDANLTLQAPPKPRKTKPTPESESTPPAVENINEVIKSGGETVSRFLKDTRNRVEDLLNNSPVPAPDEVNIPVESEAKDADVKVTPVEPKKRNPADDDLSNRLSRLSKPDDET